MLFGYLQRLAFGGKVRGQNFGVSMLGGRFNLMKLVTKVEADVFEEYAGHRLKRGWKYTLQLAVHYVDAPKVGPAFSEEAGVLSGHVLQYDLGGGQTPGFLAAKRSSQFLCGVPIDHKGSDVFVPVPQFAFLTAGY
ncbi:hypothetical protein J2857_001108 [Neorhizobium galegae]|uniref:hypothetical protein n=1 Tax=Neorhizobium galegae TaxID=399 RepID=UPI001AE3ACE5|nr:hypothetical protein [Neorhizobium galegae]MBP2558357.1 hypothetical protein [Neorhizobium galegae]